MNRGRRGQPRSHDAIRLAAEEEEAAAAISSGSTSASDSIIFVASAALMDHLNKGNLG